MGGIPHRVYTQSHIDRGVELAAEVARRVCGQHAKRKTYHPDYSPYFTGRFVSVEVP